MDIDSNILVKIKTDSIQRLSGEQQNTTNLHIDEKIYSPGDTIQAGTQQIQINKETVMVFADDEPLRNWGHNCRYFLYDANLGEFYNQFDSRFTPYLINPPESFTLFHNPVSFSPELQLPIFLMCTMP